MSDFDWIRYAVSFVIFIFFALVGFAFWLHIFKKYQFVKKAEMLRLQGETDHIKDVMRNAQQRASFDDKVAFFAYFGLTDVVSLQSTHCENWWLCFRISIDGESKKVNVIADISRHPVRENNGNISLEEVLRKDIISMSVVDVLFDNVIVQFIETGEWKNSERNTPSIMSLSKV